MGNIPRMSEFELTEEEMEFFRLKKLIVIKKKRKRKEKQEKKIS